LKISAFCSYYLFILGSAVEAGNAASSPSQFLGVNLGKIWVKFGQIWVKFGQF